MTRSNSARPITFVLLVSGLSACGIFSEQKEGPAQVNDLVGWIERVHVESEVARKKVHDSTDTLQTIVGDNFKGDPVLAFGQFKETIKQSEDQAVKLRSTVESMKKIAPSVFEKWSADLGAFSNTDMRLRSEARLASTRERYQTLIAAVDPAQSAYEAFNRGLRDHALFLGHDFNAAAVTDLRGDASTLGKLATELDGRFDRCLQAARDYVQSSALPLHAAPAPGGAGAAVPEGQKGARDQR